MGANNSDVITDLSVISERILFLETRVAELTDKVSSLEAGTPTGIGGEPDKKGDPAVFLEPPEGLGEWLGNGALLQKMAVVCFILVFALLLRTITDNGYVNVAAGSLLGLAYVSILALIGCVSYVKGKHLANVFSISGFLLLFTIVIEGHGRFGTIPIDLAYAILMTALVTSAFVGIKYRVGKLLSVSVIGVVIAGMAIGFPQVVFPLSGMLFLIANAVAFIASDRSVNGRLKWPVTLLTLLFLAFWAFKGGASLGRGEPVPAHVNLAWLAPFLLSFVGLYHAFYIGRYFKNAKPTVYDAVIPSFNVLLFFGVGGVIATDYWQQPWLLGAITLALALGHFGLGWRLLTRAPVSVVGMGGAFVAGAIAMALAVPVVVGNVAWAIPVWALMAYGLARLSKRGASGVVRILSYLYPVFALLTGLTFDIFAVGQAAFPKASLAAAASLALFGLMQFDWCRRNPPPARSLIADLDGRDRSAVVLLLVGLAGLYLLISMLLDSVAATVLADPVNTMKCGRSIIINSGAIVLLLIAGRRHELELVWIAVFLTIVGGLKVFLADLFGAGGMPLVFSVLSFGLLAMTGSVVMGRWHKGAAVA
jgi:hypothetical protein